MRHIYRTTHRTVDGHPVTQYTRVSTFRVRWADLLASLVTGLALGILAVVALTVATEPAPLTCDQAIAAYGSAVDAHTFAEGADARAAAKSDMVQAHAVYLTTCFPTK